MMGNQVVVKGRVLAAPDAPVTVRPLGMIGQVQAFGDDAPLHGRAVVPVEGHGLVHAPARRTMVNDEMLLVPSPDGIRFHAGFIPEPEPQIPEYHLACPDDHLVITDADSATARSLACYGDETILDIKVGQKLDGSGNPENHCSRPACFYSC